MKGMGVTNAFCSTEGIHILYEGIYRDIEMCMYMCIVYEKRYIIY